VSSKETLEVVSQRVGALQLAFWYYSCGSTLLHASRKVALLRFRVPVATLFEVVHDEFPLLP
jgi:hypothetical protein